MDSVERDGGILKRDVEMLERHVRMEGWIDVWIL